MNFMVNTILHFESCTKLFFRKLYISFFNRIVGNYLLLTKLSKGNWTDSGVIKNNETLLLKIEPPIVKRYYRCMTALSLYQEQIYMSLGRDMNSSFFNIQKSWATTNAFRLPMYVFLFLDEIIYEFDHWMDAADSL